MKNIRSASRSFGSTVCPRRSSCPWIRRGRGSFLLTVERREGFASVFTLLPGERCRDFVLSHADEVKYLNAATPNLRDVAILMLDTGVRIGEALSLQWADVHLVPITTARYGLVRIRGGKSKNAKRHIPLTERIREMLCARQIHQQIGADQGGWVFASNRGGPLAVDTLDKLHSQARRTVQGSKDFALHSLRHTMLSRLGEAGADAFTIMRVAGHSTVVVSQRYVHPSEESVERAFERLEALNGRRSQLSPPNLSAAATLSTTLLPAKATSRR